MLGRNKRNKDAPDGSVRNGKCLEVVMAGLLSLSVGVGHGQGVVGNLSY